MKCLDGPAMGKSFGVRRAPIFLRVVQDRETEKWDVLDLLEDEPRRGEDIHVYARISRATCIFVDPGGRYETGDYVHVPTMPEDEARIRDADLWPGWCMDKARELAYARNGTATTTREGSMESQETEGTEGELREEDVTRGDNLDDSVSEGEGLDDDRAQEAREALQRHGSTAEGEDSSSGEGPASSDPSDGQDAPDEDSGDE